MNDSGQRFEEWAAELHGHEVIYRIAGSGPPVVLIHGMINSSRHWREVAERLAADHTVIAPDLIGHGDSATPRGDYSLGAHAAVIRDLLAALGIRSATIVGHSLGGGVAMQFFWQFPERVERLVLVSSGGLGREVSPLLRLRRCPAPRRRSRSPRARGWSARSPALANELERRGSRQGRLSRRGRRALRPLRARAARAALPPDAARGDRRPRPAGQRGRPPLPARRRCRR